MDDEIDLDYTPTKTLSQLLLEGVLRTDGDKQLASAEKELLGWSTEEAQTASKSKTSLN